MILKLHLNIFLVNNGSDIELLLKEIEKLSEYIIYTLDYDKRNQRFQPTEGYRTSFSQKLPIIQAIQPDTQWLALR